MIAYTVNFLPTCNGTKYRCFCPLRVTLAVMWWITEILAGWITAGAFLAVWLGRAINHAELADHSGFVVSESDQRR